MKGAALLSRLLAGVLTWGIFIPTEGLAQITSDDTTNTIVNQNGNNFTILNGIEKGSNLFHSFRDFSIPQGGSANFDLNNTPNISNIFSRVTGGNISDIDGLIQTINSKNSVNLFLINPAGIIFGENASLNIGGSFLGTTANSIKFADEVEFSASNTNGTHLLTVDTPIGLQMGENSGKIRVQGTGYTIATENPFIVTSFTGLRVNPGETLALVGNKVSLEGGIITADSGRVELGSVEQGFVDLNSVSEAWSVGYENVTDFNDIQLLSLALADSSGNGSGKIKLQGQNILINDGSRLLIQNRGSQSESQINLKASESIKIVATDLTGELGSVLISETLGTGKAADIIITTPHLLVSEGAGITARTFSSGQGGNIIVTASESLELSKFSYINPSNGSDITTTSYASGIAGDINISTKQLTLMGQGIRSSVFGMGDAGNIFISSKHLEIIDGGGVSSVTLTPARGGDIKVDADSVELIGFNPDSFSASSLSASSVGTGEAGNLTINTGTLVLQDGGRVDSSTFTNGKAGSVEINASKSVEVSGSVPGSINPSLIVSSANILDEFLQQLLGLPPIPSGDSGNVIINTPILDVNDGGQVTVRNDGTGKGGTLSINSNSIFLNAGGVTASALSGEGGNIDLRLKNTLILENKSTISAEAQGIGNGGNITINSPIIAGFENSDIIANAVEGNGGNINITTQGIFGLQFRPNLTPESDITASSKFGVNGTVDINNFGVDPSTGIVELSTGLVDSSQQIAKGCFGKFGNSFIITGRGGIPQNPNEQVNFNRTWSDIRNLPAYSQASSKIATTNNQESSQTLIVEASQLIRNSKGEIELIAPANFGNNKFNTIPTTCVSVRRTVTN